MKLTAILLLTWATLFLTACSSKNVEIKFLNESGIHLDSTRIVINNFTTTLPEMPPYSTCVRSIPKESIYTNPRDVTVQAIPFDKDKTEFKGGYFYNDLFKPNQSAYTFVLGEDLTVVMK